MNQMISKIQHLFNCQSQLSRLLSFIKRYSKFKQQFYTNRAPSQKKKCQIKALNKFDSEEALLHKKYSRKSKLIKKKSCQFGSLPNRKKRCPLFDKGTCPHGAMCNFSHSFIPDIAKKQCKNYAINLCKKGDLCPFSHNLSRFPCKHLFILGNCPKNHYCEFSHKQFDLDFYQDFFQDNLEFIYSALQEGKNLSKNCLQFNKKVDVRLKIQKKKQQQEQYRFPLFFGVSVTRSASIKGSNNQNQSKNKSTSKIISKKQSKTEKPFSIRLASKNRNPIPEKLFQPLQINTMFKAQEVILDGNMGWQQKLQYENMDNLISEKISHQIELTPEQRALEVNKQFQFQQFSN